MRRAATTRWCSARWCATAPTSTTRSGWNRAAFAPTSRSASTHTSTARDSSPGSPTATRRRRCSRGSGATRAARATTPRSSSRSSASRSSRPGRDWIAFEHDFQRANLAEIRKYPVTPVSQAASAAPSATSPGVYFDEATETLYGGFRTPGIVDYIGAIDTRSGAIPPARRHQARDALSRDVLRLRPGERAPPSTRPTTRLPRPDGGRREDRRVAHAARGRARRRTSPSIPSTAR